MHCLPQDQITPWKRKEPWWGCCFYFFYSNRQEQEACLPAWCHSPLLGLTTTLNSNDLIYRASSTCPLAPQSASFPSPTGVGMLGLGLSLDFLLKHTCIICTLPRKLIFWFEICPSSYSQNNQFRVVCPCSDPWLPLNPEGLSGLLVIAISRVLVGEVAENGSNSSISPPYNV